MDKALIRVKEAEEAGKKEAAAVREQVEYYKSQCSHMVEEDVHRQVVEECNRLKRELEAAKQIMAASASSSENRGGKDEGPKQRGFKEYLYSPST